MQNALPFEFEFFVPIPCGSRLDRTFTDPVYRRASMLKKMIPLFLLAAFTLCFISDNTVKADEAKAPAETAVIVDDAVPGPCCKAADCCKPACKPKFRVKKCRRACCKPVRACRPVKPCPPPCCQAEICPPPCCAAEVACDPCCKPVKYRKFRKAACRRTCNPCAPVCCE